jgi:hypothetical protein
MVHTKDMAKIYAALFASIFFLSLQAAPLPVVNGGTGIASIPPYGVVCSSTANTLQPIGTGSSGQICSTTSSVIAPSFTTINREYAYIYTQTSQTVTTGSAILFDGSGQILSSGISHSTSSATDEITINTAGTYWFMYTASATSGVVYVSITINGLSDAASQFFLGATGFQLGQYITTIAAGDVIRVVNWHTVSITLNGSSTKAAASIVIKQIS